MLKFLWMDVWMSMCQRPLCLLALWCAFQLLHWWWRGTIHDIHVVHVVFKAQILHLGVIIKPFRYQDKLTDFRQLTLFQCYVMLWYCKKTIKAAINVAEWIACWSRNAKPATILSRCEMFEFTLYPPRIEVESGCVWKVSTIGGNHFLLPWLLEDG